MGDSWLMARWMNPNIAAQLQPFAEHNVLAEWASLQRSVKDIGLMEYPAGEDWAINTYGENSYLAYLAAHFNDPVGRYGDANEAQLERYRQIQNTNGAFVGVSSGGPYREAVQAYRTSMAWLQWQVANYPAGTTAAPPASLEWLSDVGIIVHRNPNFYFSICYGPLNGSAGHVMALLNVPALSVPTNAYFATPRCPGILGLGALGRATAARLVSIATNANGFTAELRLTNGTSGTTEAYVNDTGESVAIVEVPWLATGATVSAQPSFTMGIQNDPLAGGTRHLQWPGSAVTLTNFCGLTQNATNNWVCVDNRYGVAAGPGGYFTYQAASNYSRVNIPAGVAEPGAAEDTLSFVPATLVGARYAVWFPGQTAAQSSNLAAQISWAVSGTNATLTFPGAGGSPAQITATVPAQPPLPPYAVAVAGISASSYQNASYLPTNAVDGIYTNFWVSYYGPTNNRAEWLQATFARQIALAEFKIYPRTNNSGYGPSSIMMFCNVTNAIPATGIPASGSNFWSGTMAAMSTLDVKLSPPVCATNITLVITGSYDGGNTNAPRNTQVVEWSFFERAQPGTFGDWQLNYFTDAQLTNSAVSGTTADPDGDGVPNLLEFAVGGNPLVPDATNAVVRGSQISAGQFAIQFQERTSLGNVVRQFQSSGDLLNWSNVVPVAVNPLQNSGSVTIYQAVFPLQTSLRFFRLGYSVTN
jgi:hypothetical protein